MWNTKWTTEGTSEWNRAHYKLTDRDNSQQLPLLCWISNSPQVQGSGSFLFEFRQRRWAETRAQEERAPRRMERFRWVANSLLWNWWETPGCLSHNIGQTNQSQSRWLRVRRHKSRPLIESEGKCTNGRANNIGMGHKTPHQRPQHTPKYEDRTENPNALIKRSVVNIQQTNWRLCK